MTRFVHRPTTIEAMQWTGDNADELSRWMAGFGEASALRIYTETGAEQVVLDLYVAANDTWLPLEMGEWVARDVAGFYPIKDYVFQESYESEPEVTMLTQPCGYGSCVEGFGHLGPHRCSCGRPCNDPELNCDVHAAGWAEEPHQANGMEVLGKMRAAGEVDDALGASDRHGGFDA
ncbi:hypothetical protein SEA_REDWATTLEHOG_145 [Gordonia phage RedWattleHog]|nr:hypothetical protein SEA_REDWATTLEHOG_145 [Gordonia phage RedWattleHog]